MPYVLILGDSSDIVRAVAREYAKNGYGLYLAGKNVEELALEASVFEKEFGIKAKVFRFDVLEFYNHKNFYCSLDPKPIGAICAVDYLGNQYLSEDDFLETKKIIDTNYTGCISILNVIANDFEASRDGFITGITSVAGERGRRSNYTYGCAKAGFTNYLSGLRSRLVDADVKVITVKVGFVATKMNKGEELPILITAKPEEVAYDLFKAQRKGRDCIYTKWPWRYVSAYINSIPEIVFKNMNT